MSAALTLEAIETFVRITLGEPTVDVELTTDQIQSAANEALARYSVAKPLFRLGTVNALPEVQKYDIAAANFGRGIIEVMQPDMLRQPVSLEQFDVFKYHTFLPNLTPGDYMLERVWWNEVRRSAGSEEDWFVQENDDGSAVLYLNPIPSQSKTITYVYLVNPTLATVPLMDDKFIKNYTLALCKQILGRIRSKFSGIDGAEASIEMDGTTLREEGSREQEALDETLEKLGSRIPPIIG